MMHCNTNLILAMIKNLEITSLNWINCGNDLEKLPNVSGIYQIYGDSPIYGQNVLLYIGKSKNIAKRIKDREKDSGDPVTRQPNRSFRYALLEEGKLSEIEDTLIVMHKPSFNSSQMKGVGKEAKSKFIYIQNHGERGMLHLEVTNFYFLEKNHQISNLQVSFDTPKP
jgi:excinuclease UvrABC nuclease subunit